MRRRLEDGARTIRRGQIFIIMGFQRGGDEIPDRRIVLHHEDQSFIHLSFTSQISFYMRTMTWIDIRAPRMFHDFDILNG